MRAELVDPALLGIASPERLRSAMDPRFQQRVSPRVVWGNDFTGVSFEQPLWTRWIVEGGAIVACPGRGEVRVEPQIPLDLTPPLVGHCTIRGLLHSEVRFELDLRGYEQEVEVRGGWGGSYVRVSTYASSPDALSIRCGDRAPSTCFVRTTLPELWIALRDGALHVDLEVRAADGTWARGNFVECTYGMRAPAPVAITRDASVPIRILGTWAHAVGTPARLVARPDVGHEVEGRVGITRHLVATHPVRIRPPRERRGFRR